MNESTSNKKSVTFQGTATDPKELLEKKKFDRITQIEPKSLGDIEG